MQTDHVLTDNFPTLISMSQYILRLRCSIDIQSKDHNKDNNDFQTVHGVAAAKSSAITTNAHKLTSTTPTTSNVVQSSFMFPKRRKFQIQRLKSTHCVSVGPTNNKEANSIDNTTLNAKPWLRFIDFTTCNEFGDEVPSLGDFYDVQHTLRNNNNNCYTATNGSEHLSSSSISKRLGVAGSAMRTVSNTTDDNKSNSKQTYTEESGATRNVTKTTKATDAEETIETREGTDICSTGVNVTNSRQISTMPNDDTQEVPVVAGRRVNRTHENILASQYQDNSLGDPMDIDVDVDVGISADMEQIQSQSSSRTRRVTNTNETANTTDATQHVQSVSTSHQEERSDVKQTSFVEPTKDDASVGSFPYLNDTEKWFVTCDLSNECFVCGEHVKQSDMCISGGCMCRNNTRKPLHTACLRKMMEFGTIQIEKNASIPEFKYPSYILKCGFCQTPQLGAGDAIYREAIRLHRQFKKLSETQRKKEWIDTLGLILKKLETVVRLILKDWRCHCSSYNPILASVLGQLAVVSSEVMHFSLGNVGSGNFDEDKNRVFVHQTARENAIRLFLLAFAETGGSDIYGIDGVEWICDIIDIIAKNRIENGMYEKNNDLIAAFIFGRMKIHLRKIMCCTHSDTLRLKVQVMYQRMLNYCKKYEDEKGYTLLVNYLNGVARSEILTAAQVKKTAVCCLDTYFA